MLSSPLIRLALAGAMSLALASAAGAAPKLKAPNGGSVKALVIGINNYPHLPTLHGALQDAQDIDAALRTAGVQVRSLFEAQATRAAVVTEMDRLVSEAKANDLIVISFAGHGSRVPEYPRWKGIEKGGMNEEFMLWGFDRDGPATREVVVNKEVKAWLARMNAKGADVVLVADSCFGGGMMRGIAKSPRAVRDAYVPPARNQFQPIQMTDAEARVDLANLPHVTFLSGVDEAHVVDEVLVKGLNSARGALSYSFARLVEGRGAPANGVITRDVAYGYVAQQVRQLSNDQQLPSFQPDSFDKDPTILGRPILRLEAAAGQGAEAAQDVAAVNLPNVRLHVAGGGAAAVPGKPVAAFELAPKAEDADLIWNPETRELSAHGDVLMNDVPPESVAGAIDRTAAVEALKTLSQGRSQVFELKEGGRQYTPADNGGIHQPTFIARDLAGRNLLVFNLTANGLVQMLFPRNGEAARVATDVWSDASDVVAPFGADLAIAVSSKGSLDTLATWLRTSDASHAVVAAQLPQKLAEAMKADASVRIGFVGLYTRP